ncbi:MAG TPA: hypothetical protein VGL23_13265 [Chloroflexota bacterium]
MSVAEQATAEARLRRLRAALGASADALLPRAGADAAALIADELAFLARVAPAELPALWRELRTRALALAGDLPPTAESIALLEERLSADEARLRS